MEKRDTLSKNTKWLILLVIFIIILAIATFGIWTVRYAPSKERMSIKEYYGISGDQAALFINGKRIKQDGDKPAAQLKDGHFYIALSTIKSKLDDGYVYDSTEQILRYTTDSEVISVNRDDAFYTSGRSQEDMDEKIVITGGSDRTF